MSEEVSPRAVDAIADEIITAQKAVLEVWLEQSLVDPLGRGVLLTWTHWPILFNVDLSTDVPWGTVQEIKP